MSQYYNINGLKVRVSNHEPNEALNGGNDIYLWLNDATGNEMKLGWQIEKACEDFDLNIADFQKVIEDHNDIKRFCITTFDGGGEEVNEWVSEYSTSLEDAEKEGSLKVASSRANEFRFEVRELSPLNLVD